MKNKQIFDIAIYAIAGELSYKVAKHKRANIRIRVSDRILRITSNRRQLLWNVTDVYSNRLVAIFTETDKILIDNEWFEQECDIDVSD